MGFFFVNSMPLRPTTNLNPAEPLEPDINLRLRSFKSQIHPAHELSFDVNKHTEKKQEPLHGKTNGSADRKHARS